MSTLAEFSVEVGTVGAGAVGVGAAAGVAAGAESVVTGGGGSGLLIGSIWLFSLSIISIFTGELDAIFSLGFLCVCVKYSRLIDQQEDYY